MKKEKIFSTTEEQANKLINENGLDIPDITNAIRKLLYYTNFDLINGYRAPFLNTDYVSNTDPYAEHDTKIYVPGASFDEIYALYEFNSNIRALLLKYIIILETKLKGLISYYFSKEADISRYPDYLHNKQNFQTDANGNIQGEKRDLEFASLIEKIEASVEQEIANKNPAFMHFYNEKDANYPPWVVSMSITFGNISHLYKFLKDKVKNNIAREFNLMPNILSAYLRTLSQVRNVCAHGGRVYDIKFINTIKIPTAYGSRFNHKLGAVIYILKSLLDETDFSQFNYEYTRGRFLCIFCIVFPLILVYNSVQ